MKIGFIVHDMNPKTGGGRYASELVCGIKRAGHEAVVLKEENDGHEGLPIIKRGPALFSMLVKTISYFKKCDLIHAIDGYPYGIIAALVSLCLGKKLIITGLGTFAISAFYDWRWSKTRKYRAGIFCQTTYSTRCSFYRFLKYKVGSIGRNGHNSFRNLS